MIIPPRESIVELVTGADDWTAAGGVLSPTASLPVSLPELGGNASSVVTPTLSGDVDDWDPGSGSPFTGITVSTNDGTTRNITGILAPVSGLTKLLWLRVAAGSPGAVDIQDLDVASAVANRVNSPVSPTSLLLSPRASCLLMHNGTTWDVMGVWSNVMPPAGDGTAAQILTTDASGGSSWATPDAAGGALLAVSSTTLGSPAATVTVSGFDATSRLWLVVLTKLQPVNVNVQFQMEMRLGGSFPSDFKMHDHTMTHGSAQSGYSGQNAPGGAERIRPSAGNITNDADFAGNLQILISNPGATDERKTIRYSGEFWIDSTPNKIQLVVGIGGHDSLSGAFDALLLRYSAGNIAAGLICDIYKYDTP